MTCATVNGRPALDLTAKTNERLRPRLINGCPRAPIGLKVENLDVRVMAIDGQPAEPFAARDGQVVLPPSSRVDVAIDVTGAPGTSSSILLHDGTAAKPIARLTVSKDAPFRPAPLPAAAPLPSNGLPARLDLQGALRTDLSLDPVAAWVTPADFAATSAPAYRAKRGADLGGGHQQSNVRANDVPSARPSLPPARSSRRWLEAVLAGHTVAVQQVRPSGSPSPPNMAADG